MANFRSILICIQARTDSKRFPRKAFASLNGKPLLQHVIDTCTRASTYINKHTHKTRNFARVMVAVPDGDEIYSAFKGRVDIFQGPADDVLKRYALAAAKAEADLIVRITGDCPLLPEYQISKNITTAIVSGYDYYSNVDPRIRTSPDGHDVEIMTRAVLNWLDETATDPSDREHVTTLIRREPPGWAKMGHVVNHLDLSHIKVSVDTPEDLANCEIQLRRIEEKAQLCAELYGRGSAHRL